MLLFFYGKKKDPTDSEFNLLLAYWPRKLLRGARKV